MGKPKTKYRGRELLEHVEGGLLLLLDAVKADDPKEEIIFRIEEELRRIRQTSPQPISNPHRQL